MLRWTGRGVYVICGAVGVGVLGVRYRVRCKACVLCVNYVCCVWCVCCVLYVLSVCVVLCACVHHACSVGIVSGVNMLSV